MIRFRGPVILYMMISPFIIDDHDVVKTKIIYEEKKEQEINWVNALENRLKEEIPITQSLVSFFQL